MNKQKRKRRAISIKAFPYRFSPLVNWLSIKSNEIYCIISNYSLNYSHYFHNLNLCPINITNVCMWKNGEICGKSKTF